MYFSLYLIVCIIAITIGLNIYFFQKKSISGMFFLLSTVFMSIWFINYFLFFTDYFSSIECLLYSSRINFLVGLFAAYSLLLFVTYFNSNKPIFFTRLNSKNPKISLVKYVYLPIAIISFYVFVFTDLIVSSLRLDERTEAYREIYGGAYTLVIVLYAIFGILFVFVGYHRVSAQKGLEQIRLKRIVQTVYLLFLFLMIFQVVLPLFGIWILERELIFFYLAFVIRAYIILKRYYFRGTDYGTGKILNVTISFSIAILLTNIIQEYYLNPEAQKDSMNYWASGDYNNIILITSGIIFFHLSYEILKRTFIKKFFGLTDGILTTFTGNLQKSISSITTFGALQSHIQKELKSILGSDFCRIVIYKNDTHFQEMKQYFETAKVNPIFINDMVFLEENSKFFDKEKIMNEIPKETALIFPFYDETRTNTGLFILGQKPFGDFYTIDEIESLRQIVLFIESHLRYLNTYEQIQEFSQTLDKRVDEKTMEYNDLINKQKEFISTISHEIKSPIAGAILQTDSIMDDIDDEKVSRPKIKEELNLLSVQLVKVGDLLSKLFSAQYYDTHAVTLFREKVQIRNILNMELDIYESIHEEAEFIRKIGSDMKFIEIDRIQFQQVITNLITNALKFSQPTHPVIQVEAYIKSGKFHFSVEDNGDGFSGIDISEIFDKYAVGSSGSVGLGIGLYLCRRITEMHGGKISASRSKDLGGAKISIVIPT